ncbi:elongation factor 1-beta [Plakobranchus ocellatus]|uniref:Elongation factor 1-beta n=1 Tax=Plakobranchus ocellatus TaxID=259542 RepID=A0AAV4CPW2_9GAST|nr:elongation factor 1-beta [Plakobranchus ocellatus]
MSSPLLLENVWLQQQKFEDAERLYQQLKAGTTTAGAVNKTENKCSLAGEIAQVRQDIQSALTKPPPKGPAATGGAGDGAVLKRLEALEKENKELRKKVNIPVRTIWGWQDEETKALKEKRLAEYAAKKSKKPALIAKSSIVLDVKPWDDETDMGELEQRVRSIEQDGLVWGSSKLAEVGYGIKKLVIMCVVEDDKVSIDDLSEKITSENEDLCQSVDVAAFNKI